MPVSRLKSLILLFVRLIARARGARIGKTQTDRPSTVTLAHARLGLSNPKQLCWTGLIAYLNDCYTSLISILMIANCQAGNIIIINCIFF